MICRETAVTAQCPRKLPWAGGFPGRPKRGAAFVSTPSEMQIHSRNALHLVQSPRVTSGSKLKNTSLRKSSATRKNSDGGGTATSVPAASLLHPGVQSPVTRTLAWSHAGLAGPADTDAAPTWKEMTRRCGSPSSPRRCRVYSPCTRPRLSAVGTRTPYPPRGPSFCHRPFSLGSENLFQA